jgi:hypothetical protein
MDSFYAFNCKRLRNTRHTGTFGIKNSLALVRQGTTRQSDRRSLSKLMRNFASRGRLVVSTRDPHGRIIGFVDRSPYFFFQVSAQLYSQG